MPMGGVGESDCKYGLSIIRSEYLKKMTISILGPELNGVDHSDLGGI